MIFMCCSLSHRVTLQLLLNHSILLSSNLILLSLRHSLLSIYFSSLNRKRAKLRLFSLSLQCEPSFLKSKDNPISPVFNFNWRTCLSAQPQVQLSQRIESSLQMISEGREGPWSYHLSPVGSRRGKRKGRGRENGKGIVGRERFKDSSRQNSRELPILKVRIYRYSHCQQREEGPLVRALPVLPTSNLKVQRPSLLL